MSKKLIGIQGLLVTIFFIVGFLILFISNPQTFEELNNVSLAAYNIKGMNSRGWAVIVNYIIVGAMNGLFCGTLFTLTKGKQVGISGAALLMTSGVIWLTFGLFPYDPTTDFGNHFLVIRIIFMIPAGSIGLILFGVSLDNITKNKFLKWYTLSSGFLILLLSFMSAFIFNDLTWIRTNLSVTIYFVWFGIFGSIYLKEVSAVKLNLPKIIG